MGGRRFASYQSIVHEHSQSPPHYHQASMQSCPSSYDHEQPTYHIMTLINKHGTSDCCDCKKGRETKDTSVFVKEAPLRSTNAPTRPARITPNKRQNLQSQNQQIQSKLTAEQNAT